MAATDRSGCPINLAIEVFGDRWTLLILRDMVFADRRHFRELLRGSQEKITTSILADRLERLRAAGIVTTASDPSHKQRAVYHLTEKGIDLVPVLATIGLWGVEHCAADPENVVAAQGLTYRLPESWAELMDVLRAKHDVAGPRGQTAPADPVP